MSNFFNRPECFGSNPSFQSQAENDCYTCSHQTSCAEYSFLNEKAQFDLKLRVITTDKICCKLYIEGAYLSAYKHAIKNK